MGSQMPSRIDTHAHMLPPFYRQACIDHGHGKPDGMPRLPEWSEEAHLKLMDDNNISKSILSISSPGTHLVHGNDELAASLTRQCNAYSADLKKRKPDRFGYFASLPIPDVDTCLREIKLASEEGCDGFVMLTNGHGLYPGDPKLDSIFAELNARQAILFLHPTTPWCLCSPGNNGSGNADPTLGAPLMSHYPSPFFEFLFDTARFVIHMFLSGTLRRYRNIRILLPHLGGVLPPLLSRFTAFSTMVPGNYEAVDEAEVREALARQFWFDLAGIPFPGQIVGLVQGMNVSPERLLYGSDFPFTPQPAVEKFLEKMDEGIKGMLDANEIDAVYHGNAEKLFGSVDVK